MIRFGEKLDQQGFLLLDSAMGTMLQRAGLNSGEECGELWNTGADREKVKLVHKANIEAGSDIVITNTFGANVFKLDHYGLGGRAAELNREGASLARVAAGGSTLVAGDIGPTGEILEQWGGTRTADDVAGAYAPQVEGLVEGGVDLFILETFMDIEELLLALRAVRERSELPVIASVTFSRGAGGLRTMWGLEPGEAAARLERAGVEAVGTNCGLGPDDMLEVVAAMRQATSLPLAAQPNAGSPEVREGKTVYPESAAVMAEKAAAFRDAGASMLGGCCGTDPEYIASVKKALGS